MNIVKATKQYENWLRLHIRIVEPDLRIKHEQMAAALFPFFRATFYRWLQVWPEECEELDRVPHILSVGDLHVENFGTWRDTDGRLIWGVNDFDEASWLSYTNDLVRLVASANMAIDANHITLDRKTACNAVFEGYQRCIAAGGRPFVLAEDHPALREMARHRLKEPEKFWAKLSSLTPI